MAKNLSTISDITPKKEVQENIARHEDGESGRSGTVVIVPLQLADY